MNFIEQKKKQLSKKDISNIGKWDSKIKGLCDKINKDEMLSLYTELNSSMNMLSGFVVNLNKIMRTKFNEINEI